MPSQISRINRCLANCLVFLSCLAESTAKSVDGNSPFGNHLTNGTEIPASTNVKLGRILGEMLISQQIFAIGTIPDDNVNAWTVTYGFGAEDPRVREGSGPILNNTGSIRHVDVPRFEVGQAESRIVAESENSINGTRGDSDQHQRIGVSDQLSVCPEPSTALTSGIGIVVLLVSSTSLMGLLYGSRSRRRMAMKVCGRCFDKVKAHRHAKL